MSQLRRGHLIAGAIVLASALELIAAWVWRESLADRARVRLEWLTATRSSWLLLGIVLMASVSWVLSKTVLRSVQLPARTRPRSSAPTSAWLLLVIASFASLSIVLSAETTIPRVLGDELIYSGIAKSLAVQGHFLLRDEIHLGHSILYPLLISPMYWLARDGAAAHAAVQATNALLMSLTALPAWAIARRVVPGGWALAVAVLSAAGPWLAFSAWVMTESAFYPAVTAFALLLVMTIERPTLFRQGSVLVAVGVIAAIRAQALVLLLAVILAVLLFGLTSRALRTTLRALAPLTIGAMAILLAGSLALVLGVASNVTAYAAVFDGSITLGGLVRWSAWNLAILALTTGCVAAVAFPGATAELLRSQAPTSERAVGTVMVAQFIAITASVAILSASKFGLGLLQERTIFYLAPLLFTGMAVWLHRGLRTRRPATAAAGAVGVIAIVAWLPADIPNGTTVESLLGAIHNAPFGLSAAVAVAILGVIAAFLPGSAVWPVFFVGATMLTVTAADQTSWNSPISQAQSAELAWIDQALPDGATAKIVHISTASSGQTTCEKDAIIDQQALVLLSEFLNTRATYAGYLYDPYVIDYTPERELTLGQDLVLLDRGRPLGTDYLAVDSRVPVAGSKVARIDLNALRPDNYSHGASLTLWRVQKPARLDIQGPLRLTPRPDGQPCA